MQGDVILNNYSQFCGFELVLVEILTGQSRLTWYQHLEQYSRKCLKSKGLLYNMSMYRQTMI
jgi:hypothetical protein